MRSKFILTVAASLLAGTVIAAAQQSGAPANEGNSDSSINSGQAQRPGTQGQGGSNMGGAGDARNQTGPVIRDNTPLQPGGISPSAPPEGNESAQPRPR